MPNRDHRKKSARQAEDARLRNKTKRSAMRTQVGKVLAAVAAGDKPAAEKELVTAQKRIDKCAKSNVIHPNTASRKKAGLARKVASI